MMRIEGYPIALSIDADCPDPVCLYLVDLPGCGVQATTVDEAMAKLEEVVPRFLEQLRASGKKPPPPSDHSFIEIPEVELVTIYNASQQRLTQPEPFTAVLAHTAA